MLSPIQGHAFLAVAMATQFAIVMVEYICTVGETMRMGPFQLWIAMTSVSGCWMHDRQSELLDHVPGPYQPSSRATSSPIPRLPLASFPGYYLLIPMSLPASFLGNLFPSQSPSFSSSSSLFLPPSLPPPLFLPPSFSPPLPIAHNNWLKLYSSGECPSSRDGHACTSVGAEMFIHGGFSASVSVAGIVPTFVRASAGTRICSSMQEVRFSKDLYAFNMDTHMWRKLPNKVLLVLSNSDPLFQSYALNLFRSVW